MLNPTDDNIIPITSRQSPSALDNPVVLDDTASSRSLYRAMLDACPHATVYHTLEWIDTFRGQGTKLQFVRFGDDAVVPFLCRGRGLLRRGWSLPFDTYGGVVGPLDQPVSFDAICRALDIPSLRVVDFGDRVTPGGTSVFHGDATTHVVGLADGYEATRSRYTDSCRRLVRQAQRRGVEVNVMEDDSLLPAFHRLHVQTVGRRGARAFPPSFFAGVYRNLVLRGLARFYLARQGDDIVGGNIVLRYRDRACDWMWVYDARRPDLRVTNAMIDRAIEDEFGYGSIELNLGTSPDDRQGSVRFKRSFGAAPRPYRIMSRRGWGHAAAHRARVFVSTTARYAGMT